MQWATSMELAENDRHEMTDQLAGHEIAGHETSSEAANV